MPKVKVPRKSTTVDMTAMTDVAFLLLTFFMLATQFKPEEPVEVQTPSSIAEIPLPDVDIMTITISKDNRVFFSMDQQHYKKTLLEKMGTVYNINFTPDEMQKFSMMESFGVPIAKLKQLLALKPEERAKFPQEGIPCDSTNNELANWIWQARMTNNKVRVAIKGDQDANYPIVKQVIATLQDKKVNRFNFITSLSTEETK
jgi:biopolymer transport protein ExbD